MAHTRNAARAAGAVGLVMLCAGSALGQSYVVQKLPSLPGGFSAGANDINDSGVVVGWSSRAGDSRMHAVKWVNGVAIELDPLGWWEYGEAVAISNSGFIATNQGTPTNCFPQGVQLFGPTSTVPMWRMDYQGMLSAVRAMNSSLTTVGCAGDMNGVLVPVKWTSTMPSPIGPATGSATDAVDINDAGVAVGFSSPAVSGLSGTSVRAVKLQGGQVIDLPTPSDRARAFARSINSAGLIVGDADNGTNPCSWLNIDSKPVIWNGDAVTALPMPTDVTSANATDINDRGEIVGLGVKQDWTFGPVLWRQGGEGGRADFLTSLVPNLNGMFSIERVDTINNKGQMVGWGYSAGTFAITPVVLTPCWGNFNGTGGTTVQDVFDFLDAMFAGSLAADVDRNSTVNTGDLFSFLGSWFTGCP